MYTQNNNKPPHQNAQYSQQQQLLRQQQMIHPVTLRQPQLLMQQQQQQLQVQQQQQNIARAQQQQQQQQQQQSLPQPSVPHVEFQLPPQFICPFTCRIMKSPVMSIACGHHFECSAIRQLFSENNLANEQPLCPIDSTPLDASRIIPAHELQAVIQQWPHIQQYLEAEQHQHNQRSVEARATNPTQLRPQHLSLNPGDPLTMKPISRLSNPTYNTNPNINSPANPPQHTPVPLTHANLPAATACPGGGLLGSPSFGAQCVVPTDVAALWEDPLPFNMRPNNNDGMGNINGLSPLEDLNGTPESEMDPDDEARQQQLINANDDKTSVDPRKYKTRLCRNWVQTGQCAYEDVCCFAHGDSELRDPAANLKVLSDLGYFLEPPETHKLAPPPIPVSSPHTPPTPPVTTAPGGRGGRSVKPATQSGVRGNTSGVALRRPVVPSGYSGGECLEDAEEAFASQGMHTPGNPAAMQFQTISLTMEQLTRLGLGGINMGDMHIVPQQNQSQNNYKPSNMDARNRAQNRTSADPAVLMWQPLQ